jgi:hypothetical protein
MKIKLNKAIDLLQGSAAVIVNNCDDKPVVYAKIDYEIFINWTVDGLEYDVTIPFEGNESVEIENSTMALIDEDGEIVELKLLFPSQLSSFCQEEDIA